MGGGRKTNIHSGASLEAKIRETFPEDPETAVAVSKAESRMKAEAVGYNCVYEGRSQSCKKGDESKAWSVDCGLMQINSVGKSCPEELMNPDNNLRVAKNIKEKGGWERWWTFKTGKHLAFIN